MDNPRPDYRDYRLLMRPAPDWEYPEMVSLRRLLKAFLRRYGFEMLSVEEIERKDKRPNAGACVVCGLDVMLADPPLRDGQPVHVGCERVKTVGTSVEQRKNP